MVPGTLVIYSVPKSSEDHLSAATAHCADFGVCSRHYKGRRPQAHLLVTVSLRSAEITKPLNTVSNLRHKKQIQNSFILKYKLDNCASDFRDVGARGEKEQTERKRRERNKRDKVDELRQKMVTKEGEKRRNMKWGVGGKGIEVARTQGWIEGQTHSTWRKMEEGKIAIIMKQQETRMKEKAAKETQKRPVTLPVTTSVPSACRYFIHSFYRSIQSRGNEALYKSSLHECLVLLTVPRRDRESVTV